MESFIKKSIIITKIELACYVAPGEGARVHKNRANHGLVLSLSGERDYIFDSGKNVTSTPNNILYLPKYSNYSINGQKGNCFAINFEMQENGDLVPFSFKIKNKSTFLDLFKHIESAWRMKPPGFEMKCMAELYQILFAMRKEFEDGYISKGHTELIRPSIEYIHSKYESETITISQLARLCNISENYFRRIFQKAFGTSPLKYINHLRIERAKELILSDMYSITMVAQMSGFNDEAYFSREFKKAVGVCPSEFKSHFNCS